MSILPLPDAPEVPMMRGCKSLADQEQKRLKAWAVWLYRRMSASQRSAVARAIQDTSIPLLSPQSAKRAIEKILLAEEMRGSVFKMIDADPRIAESLPDDRTEGGASILQN